MTNRALLVGIEDYKNRARLRAAVRDVRDLAALLEADHQGGERWQVEVLEGPADDPTERVTEPRFREALGRAITETGSDGHLLVYFAGHGETDGDDGRHAHLVLQGRRETYADGAVLNDDDRVALTTLMTTLNFAPAASVTLVLDCCYAGAAGEDAFGVAGLRRDQAVMASTSRRETALDGHRNSPFATHLLAGLEGAAANPLGEVSVTQLYEYVAACFGPLEQKPTLKVNMTTQPFVLRQAEGTASPDDLRALLRLFPNVDHHKQLSPEHEGPAHLPKRGRPLAHFPDQEPTVEQRDFDLLARLRDHQLIHTHPHPHKAHYFVAMDSEYVKLSPKGRWYWRQVRSGRIGAEG